MAGLEFERIVILTGSGISADSGHATFRGSGGLWQGRRFEEVATPGAFVADPELVHRFYNLRRRQLRDPAIQPNAGHRALARLEREWPGEVLVITQNVDNLHERSGTLNLLHMHGELARCRCVECGEEFEWFDDLETRTACPNCGRTGCLRPAIVWFGEQPCHMQKIEHSLEYCDLFVAIGTSHTVYPAAGFIALVNTFGTAHTVVFNLEPAMHSAFAEHYHGRACDLLPRWVDRILESPRTSCG